MKTRNTRSRYPRFLLLLIALTLSSADCLQAGPADTWHWRNPMPQGHSLGGVAYGNGLFVAVGEFGTILTSRDGSAWEIQNSGTDETLRSITFGNGTFMAVGGSTLSIPAILTSRDGIAWTSLTPRDGRQLLDVAFGNGIFVAVGPETILASRDGVAWTNYGALYFSTFEGVTFGNGNFVIVGSSGAIMTSTDGSNWTKRSSGVSNDLQSIAYGTATFVAAGVSGTMVTSPDGIAWTKQNSGISVTLRRTINVGGIFVSAGSAGTVLTSNNGVAWTKRNSGTSYDISGLANGGGTLVAVGLLGTILTSSDASVWTSQDFGTRIPLSGIAFGNGVFVTVGSTGTIQTSHDGTVWKGQTSGTTNDLFGVTSGNNLLVSVGGGGTILNSADGSNWTSRNSGISNNTFNKIRAVTFGKGTFVAVGELIPVLTSSDGAVWRTQAGGGNYEKVGGYYLFGAAFGNGLFIAVGYAPVGTGSFTSRSGSILVSPDGVNWTAAKLSSKSTLNIFTGVTFAKGMFVVSGDLGAILTSTDGINWTDQSASVPVSNPRAVAFGNDTFVAVGGSGKILSSTNGITWTNRVSGTYRNLEGVAFGNGTFVTVGDVGTILQSGSVSSTPLPRPVFGVAPASITNDFQGKVTFSISGVATGQVVNVETYLDENGNGQADPDEPLIQSFSVSDGVLPFLNGQRNTNVSGDEDGAANGQIRVELDYARRTETDAVASAYAFKISSPSGGFAPATAPFVVNQKVFPQGVSGTVASSGKPTPISGALVALFDIVGNKLVTSAYTDANGHFTLYSPPGAFLVLPLRRGFVGKIDFSDAAAANIGDLPLVFIRSGEMLQKNLSLTSTDRTVSGVVSDKTNGRGLAGVEIFASSLTTNSVASFTFAITDSAGHFSLPVTSGAWSLQLEPRTLARLGYLSPQNIPDVDATAGSVGGVTVPLPKATSLIYGRLANEAGAALMGVNITAVDSVLGYQTQALSDSNGNYALGVTSGDWSVDFDFDTISALGYEPPTADVTISTNANVLQTFVFKRSTNAGTVAISALIPDHGPAGTRVEILGLNFTGATAVKFNGVECAFTVDTATQISATVPNGATTGPISIVTPVGTASSADEFTVTSAIAPPLVQTPPQSQTAIAGSSVTFSVLATGGAPLNYQWQFNGTNIQFATNANFTLSTVASFNAGNYSVVVSNAAGSVTSVAATLVVTPAIPAPQITNFSPLNGPPGTAVTILGNNFGGVLEVKFGNLNAGFIVLSATQILTVAPPGASTVAISVLSEGGVITASTTQFTVLASGNALPTVRMDAPAAGDTFNVGASIFLSAVAHDDDGTIRHVDYYANGTLIYGLDTFPVSTLLSSYTWPNVAAGTYRLSVTATDDRGARAISSSFVITVGAALNAPALKISRSAGGLILAWPTNAVGFTLESTTSFSPAIQWTNVPATSTVSGIQFQVVEPITNPNRFYRLKRSP